ncbi:hypothetical protein FR5810_03082 [Bordetella pertussis]|nr:hypothetical protein FR5810_03082 [Bordetella pertussis]
MLLEPCGCLPQRGQIPPWPSSVDGVQQCACPGGDRHTGRRSGFPHGDRHPAGAPGRGLFRAVRGDHGGAHAAQHVHFVAAERAAREQVLHARHQFLGMRGVEKAHGDQRLLPVRQQRLDGRAVGRGGARVGLLGRRGRQQRLAGAGQQGVAQLPGGQLQGPGRRSASCIAGWPGYGKYGDRARSGHWSARRARCPGRSPPRPPRCRPGGAGPGRPLRGCRRGAGPGRAPAWSGRRPG